MFDWQKRFLNPDLVCNSIPEKNDKQSNCSNVDQKDIPHYTISLTTESLSNVKIRQSFIDEYITQKKAGSTDTDNKEKTQKVEEVTEQTKNKKALLLQKI